MIKLRAVFAICILLCIYACTGSDGDTETIVISPSTPDFTTELRNRVEATEASNLRIVLEEGCYKALPDFATERYCTITNHNNGVKKILFALDGFDSVTIEGNGAEIICHGQLFPFLVENCSNITISDLTIDWDIPFTFLSEIVDVNVKEGWRDVRPYTDGYSWKLEKGRIMFPNIDGYVYPDMGASLAFEKDTKRVVLGASGFASVPTKVESRPNGVLRIYERIKCDLPIGSLLSSKGTTGYDRYAPAFDFKECRNVLLDGVTIHHALGMGVLFERTEDITLRNLNIVVREGSPRVVSSTADASHYANCRGDILLENCRFENMLDDGVNVHGTYVKVNEVTGANSVIASLGHVDQVGFKFADVGDEVWFIMAPSPDRQVVNRICGVREINEKYMELTFEEDLPDGFGEGSIIENKTWNANFTMRNCVVQNNRARSIVLKSPLKILIENNTFSSMMSAIYLRSDTFFWYESGGVNDVTIRNNLFKNNADCAAAHAVLYVSPRLGSDYDVTKITDYNITFEENTIDSFVPRMIYADRVENLVVRSNKIIRNSEHIAPRPDDPMFELTNCKNTIIENNEYVGAKHPSVMLVDVATESTLTMNNNGF